MSLFKSKTDENDISKKLKKQKKKTVQETIPYEEVYDNGMFLNSPGVYSRMYSFMDANFDTESEDKQESIMTEFKKVLNKFSHNVTVQYNIINEKVPIEKLEKDYYISPKSTDIVHPGDDENEVKRKESVQEYREEYNQIILGKIKEGRNDIRKKRYVTLAIEAPDIIIANKTFITLENALNEAMKKINKDGVHLLNVEDRLAVLRAIFHSGNGEDFAKMCDKYRNEAGEFKLELLSKKGMTTKDFICPEYMINGREYILMGSKLLAKSFLISDLPPDMESNFLSEITNVPAAMMVSVIHKTKLKSKALKEVKQHNNSIKAEVVKANQEAFKNNYDPSLMSEALIDAKDEGSFLVQDMTVRNQKLFYTTVTVTILANSIEDMTEFVKMLQMKVEDFACQAVDLQGQQMIGLKTSLPFASKFIGIDRMLTTDAACAFFPFSIQELMDPKGHFYGLNQITDNMIVYNRRESALPNGLVFGKAGSGKSFISKLEVVLNLLDYDDDVIVLDPDGEYAPIANVFGGTVINLSNNSDIHINPLDLDMEYDGDKDADPVTDKINFVTSLIEVCAENEILTSYDITVIQRCARRMYQPYIQHMDGMYERDKKEGRPIKTIDYLACPTLLDLYEEFLKDNSQEGQRLAMIIEPFASGMYSMFANKTTLQGSPRFLVYNLKKLTNRSLKNFVMKVCLSDIWNRATRNRDAKKGTWVYLDEFYLLAQTESARQTLQEYFKRIRKYFGIMTGITQDAEDLVKDAEGRGMFNNTGFTIMMNQSEDGRMILGDRLGITPSLLSYIQDKEPGTGLIYNGKSIIPFDCRLPADSKLYKLLSTKPSE